MRVAPVFLCLLCLLQATAAAVEIPQPIFYLPLEGSTTAALAAGSPVASFAAQRDPILSLVESRRNKFTPGQVGLCYDVNDAPLAFACDGNFRPDEGTCSFWLSPHFDGGDTNLYCTFFGAADWGMLYKYVSQTTLSFGTARPEGDLYYDCGSSVLSTWRVDQWYHVVLTWSRQQNARSIFVDGKLVANAPFPFHRKTDGGEFFVGAGCTMFPGYIAHARIDELAIWDHALDESVVVQLHKLGLQGKPLWLVETMPEPVDLLHQSLSAIRPSLLSLPPPPRDAEREPTASLETPTRQSVSLAGWWALQLAQQPLAQLPEERWGLTRVPGYWTAPGQTVTPDGQEVRGQWNDSPVSEFSIAYHARTFAANPQWRDHSVVLQIDGVEGLADVLLNGRRIGRLSSWESESYDIGSLLRYDEENLLVLVLSTRRGSPIAGIYGDVSLRILPATTIQDVVVTPSVENGRVRFSADLWNPQSATDARIEFTVSPDSATAGEEKRFTHECRLSAADRGTLELSSQSQRIDCEFDWPDAHRWTYDDPFLYNVCARLFVGDRLVDQTAPVRFGFREFTMRGSTLLLNGTATHLRGHQIDLAWADQLARVKELKAAGMNCLELSGPISHDWYQGEAYRWKLFEEILDYADQNGVVVIPVLPSAKVLKERIFEPEVASLYHRRVDKHVRRWGNHASICMWYMNFNLAGYHWYLAPTKIDGSYKPDNAQFAAKERYSVEAQRIVQAFDPRPIYHHACGNFGDIFTLNCYLGPTSPLQEREEWPSRWAEKRPFPLIACEHGLMLVPYWFRPRRFPLSEVYAGEPIFDELAAKYLGARVYAAILPELFELYDVDRQPRSSRLKSLVGQHPGYQEVKSLFAKHSLRSWRTYGVSGIIFNAINWDFKDGDQELPVMRALARYFGDTDLYVAGPGDDWPSKDYSFYDGEVIRKQVVLLNDLTRDLSCPMQWRLEDATGKSQASGQVEAVAQAGVPTMVPLEFVAPQVTKRTSFRLVVEPAPSAARHFLPDTFELEVFPTAKPMRPSAIGEILVYDTTGDTTAMLAQAGISAQPLTRDADLDSATLVIVGRKSFDADFLKQAAGTGLEKAVVKGLNLLIFEQSADEVMGLKLQEQSARRVFFASNDHPLTAGLADQDLINLRGVSDLVPSYPPAPPETEHQWPARFFKWGNRGVTSSFVYTKPHYAPFVPVLECGFDLVDSPLLEAHMGRGRVVLCQVDVTPRYGTDPVSTQLVNNLLSELTRPSKHTPHGCVCIGDSAARFVQSFGIETGSMELDESALIVVGTEPLTSQRTAEILAAAKAGSTVLLLPGCTLAPEVGLQRETAKLFLGRITSHPLLAGLHDGDLYLKAWTEMEVALPGSDWQLLVEPGLVAVKPFGQGRIVACQLDVAKLGQSRGRVKALRFYNILLANLGVRRSAFDKFLQPEAQVDQPNSWEQIPPFINW